MKRVPALWSRATAGEWDGLTADVPALRQQAPGQAPGPLRFGLGLRPARPARRAGGSRAATLQGNNLALFKDHPHADAAWAALAQLARPESDLAWTAAGSYLPVMLANGDRVPFADDLAWRVVWAQARRADTRPMPLFTGFQEVANAIGAELVAAFHGQNTPREALRDPVRGAAFEYARAPGSPVRPPRGAGTGAAGDPDAAWPRPRERIAAGGPNTRLGLVQAQYIFKRDSGGHRLVPARLVRVRVPAALIEQGDDAWHPNRFEAAWWMRQLRPLGAPLKVVLELSPRAAPERHAEHAARLLARVAPEAHAWRVFETAVVDRRGGSNYHRL